MMPSEGIREMVIRYRFSKGALVRLAMPGDAPNSPNLITREKDNGERVDELHMSWIQGYVQRIFTTTKEYQKNEVTYLSLVLRGSDGMIRVFRTDITWRVATDILDRFDNINLRLPIELHAGINGTNGFLWITQAEKNVPKKYSKDTPHDKPKWEQVIVSGKPQWDRTKELAFWNKKLIDWSHKLNQERVEI